MLIVEFERTVVNSRGAIAVRILNPGAHNPKENIVAEELFTDGLPDGLSLKDDVPFAVLRLHNNIPCVPE